LSVVFFTDRDLGLQFPAVLRDAGLSVERHVDHFPPDCPDETWLREVGDAPPPRRRARRCGPPEGGLHVPRFGPALWSGTPEGVSYFIGGRRQFAVGRSMCSIQELDGRFPLAQRQPRRCSGNGSIRASRPRCSYARFSLSFLT
jgi:hypothetical protein